MKNQHSEVIKMFNDHTQEIIEEAFDDPIDADYYEYHLDLLQMGKKMKIMTQNY